MKDPDTIETPPLDLGEHPKLLSVIRDMMPAKPAAPLARPQCPFCFRYDGLHNSRCDAATQENVTAPAEVVEARVSRYRSPGRRGDRMIDNIQRQARELAEEAAFEKSEQLYPMAGNVPEAVREDRLFRAIYHVWKKNGGRQSDPRVQRMRERWVALTTGVELVKGQAS